MITTLKYWAILVTLVIAFDASAEVGLANGDMEADADSNDWPDGFTSWARSNTSASFVWDGTTDHTFSGRQGHSVRISVDEVTSGSEGLGTVIQTAEGVLPGAVYEFSAFVRTSELMRCFSWGSGSHCEDPCPVPECGTSDDCESGEVCAGGACGRIRRRRPTATHTYGSSGLN